MEARSPESVKETVSKSQSEKVAASKGDRKGVSPE
jgi:hypothetical protein